MNWYDAAREWSQRQEEAFLLKDIPLLCFEPKHIQANLRENPKDFNFDKVMKGYIHVIENNLRSKVWPDFDRDRLLIYAKFVRDKPFRIARIKSVEYTERIGYSVLYKGSIPFNERAADNIYATLFAPGRIAPAFVINGSPRAKELKLMGY